jgi:hypothetical protein
MGRITLDAALLSKLTDLKEPTELCDSSGEVVGRFIPAFDASEYELVPDDISDEELDRRANSNEKTYTTAEVLAYLEKL